jgi:hypothetical protein
MMVYGARNMCIMSRVWGQLAKNIVHCYFLFAGGRYDHHGF